MTRFILLGRRRGEQTCDHGGYVSMRESRHVKGVYTVNLKDLMDFRTYPDALYTCYSNYDPKGKLDADVIYCGVLPPQVKIQIPLSALLPCEKGGGQMCIRDRIKNDLLVGFLSPDDTSGYLAGGISSGERGSQADGCISAFFFV